MDFTRNFFELFDIPVSFTIDLASLAERYRSLQHIAHPDKFASASDQQRRLSVQQSALINEAYQTLKDPLARAKYLLSLNGLDMSATKDTIMAPEFLMQQMELRERLAGIEQEAEPVHALMQLQDEVGQTTRQLIDDIAMQFQKLNTASADHQQDLKAIHDKVQRLQFMIKLENELQVMEENLMP